MTNVKAFALLGIGYLLLFSAIVDKGKYAKRPWGAMSA